MSPIPDRIPPGRIRLTYDDYVGLPNDGKRYEILDGELSVSPAPGSRHQIASINLSTILNLFVRQHRLGRVLEAPTDVVLAPTTIVQPDILFVRTERVSIITERAVEGSPDLLVEILSTGTARQDRTTKAALYARFAIPHYWIVDPETRAMELYEIDSGSYRLVTQESGEATIHPILFPGLQIALADVWD